MNNHHFVGSDPSDGLKGSALPSRQEQLTLSRFTLVTGHSFRDQMRRGAVEQSLMQTAEGRRCMALCSALVRAKQLSLI